MCVQAGSLYGVCVCRLVHCMVYVCAGWFTVWCMCVQAGSLYGVCVCRLVHCMVYVCAGWFTVWCMCVQAGSLYGVCVCRPVHCMCMCVQAGSLYGVCVCRLVHMAGVWYAYHLQVSGKAPTIVIVTETPEVRVALLMYRQSLFQRKLSCLGHEYIHVHIHVTDTNDYDQHLHP